MTTIDIAPVRHVRLFKLGMCVYLVGTAMHGIAIGHLHGWGAGLDASAKGLIVAGGVLVLAHGIRWIIRQQAE